MYGSAAVIVVVRGAKPGAAARGLSQITVWARRRSLAMAAASRSGGSPSQPSEAISTTAPRRVPPWCEARRVLRQWAMRVPPNRSVTRSVASSNASWAEWCARTVVSRVKDVANAKASACVVSVRARIRCRQATACACIDRLTSHSTTTRRGRSTGPASTSRTGSQPVRRARATVSRIATRWPLARTA
jgi:hypothetical protein